MRLLGSIVAMTLAACQPIILSADASFDGGACGAVVVPGAAGDGALRGCSGCDAPRAVCGEGEYEVSTSCHEGQDGGWYAVGGVAGSWCYASPMPCGSRPTCQCLMEHGAFQLDGGLGLGCPGAYWSCFEGTDQKNLHCNPP
jgi:hypothetical protein